LIDFFDFSVSALILAEASFGIVTSYGMYPMGGFLKVVGWGAGATDCTNLVLFPHHLTGAIRQLQLEHEKARRLGRASLVRGSSFRLSW
jgi:hypothetical protein